MTTSKITNETKCCIVRVPEDGKLKGEKLMFRNCDSIEQAISIINNQTFKNNPINEGEGINFTSHTENNYYYIIEGNRKPSKMTKNGTSFL